MPRLRTRTVSTKVSAEDYAMFEQVAGAQKVGEWVRDDAFGQATSGAIPSRSFRAPQAFCSYPRCPSVI